MNGPDAEFASGDVTFTGGAVTDVRLISTKSWIIGGRIVFGSADFRLLNASTIRVGAALSPVGGRSIGPFPPPGDIAPDWTFRTRARPGLTRLRLLDLQSPWTMKAVRYRGADITDAGLEVRAGEDLTDLEVELSDRTTDITGVVRDSRAEIVHEYGVLLFALDREKRRPPSRYVRTASPDQDGRFKIGSLPASEYLAFGSDDPGPDDAVDPDVLEHIEGRATRVSLAEGEAKTLDLKLNTVP